MGGSVASQVRLARTRHAQGQARVVQGIQEAGHIVVPHSQAARRPAAKVRLRDVEKVVQSSLMQAETALYGVRDDPGESRQGGTEESQPGRDAEHEFRRS